tara:strand:+ start:1500 stop:1883 length:384 start_codon:yes stop_codon:yes gene_type:complete
MVLLGTPESKGVTIPVDIPTFIPPQQLEMIDTSTGKKKLFTVDNISKLIALLSQGYQLFTQIRGGTGSQTVYVTQTDFSREPTDGWEKSGGGSSGGGKEAGISVNSLIGYGVAAAIMLSLYMTLKDK